MTLGEFLDLTDKLDITADGFYIRHAADYFEVRKEKYIDQPYNASIYYNDIKQNLDNYEYISCMFHEDMRDPSIYCKKLNNFFKKVAFLFSI